MERVAALVLVLLVAGAARAVEDPFADTVVSFTAGTNAGFGQEELPGVVLGPPHGAGGLQGSFDVVSLGNDGSIVVGFDLPVICDGPGADFTVFENAFHSGSLAGPLFVEYGIVAVSQDGEHFVELPYDPISHAGLAGQTPVFSNPDNEIDPLDPTTAGGDSFDLAAVGLSWAAYVRIIDPGAAIADPGNLIPPSDNSGFDLDAVAALHACDPAGLPTSTVTTMPTAPPTPTATPSAAAATVTPSAEATPTRSRLILTSTPTRTRTPAPGEPSETPTSPPPTESPEAPTPTETVAPRPGDLDGDGGITAADARWLVVELCDGDGDEAANAGNGTVSSNAAAADVNGDGRITAADLLALASGGAGTPRPAYARRLGE